MLITASDVYATRRPTASEEQPAAPFLPFIFKPGESWLSLSEAMENVHLEQLEQREVSREERLRERALPIDLPTDDDTWHVLNVIRHKLIDQEISGQLSPEGEALLGTLEVLSDQRLEEAGAFSTTKANEILARLEGNRPE